MCRTPNWAKFTFLILFSFTLINVNGQSVRKSQIQDLFLEKLHPAVNPTIKSNGSIVFRDLSDIQFSDNHDQNISEGEPFLCVNPNSPDHIVASFMQLEEVLDFPIFYSIDGGLSWERSEFSPSSIFELDFPDQIIAGGGDPILAFDKDGRLFFSWIYLGLEGLDGNVVTYWAYSDDGGRSFSISERNNHILEQGVFQFSSGEIKGEGEGIFDRPWFGVDRSEGMDSGSLYCIGLFIPKEETKIEGNGIVLRKKFVDVDSFETVQLEVSNTENAQFSNVVVDQYGDIHMSYVNLDTKQLIYSNSIDGGNTIFQTMNVSPIAVDSNGTYVHNRENPAPSLAVCPITENIYLVWSTFQNEHVEGFFTVSKDFGSSWVEPVQISSFSEGDSNQVLMPVIMVNNAGHLAMSWFNLDTLDVGTYKMAFSDDEGMTFRNIHDVSSDTTDFGEYSGANFFFGDYTRSEFVDDFAHFIWSDGRNSEGAKVYYRKMKPKDPVVSNIFVSPITDLLNCGDVFKNHSGIFALPIKSSRATRIECMVVSANGQILNQWHSFVEVGKNTIHFPEGPYPFQTAYIKILSEVGYFVRPFLSY